MGEARQTGDRWSRWLAEPRFAGDPDVRRRVFAELLVPIRDRVLDAAEPVAGARVLDVGCGEGLIAFGALERGAAQVTFADVSAPLLAGCAREAEARGLAELCRFVDAPAEDLAPVATASVDVLTLRSVLIYVARKRAAFAECARVLRPGGRLSLFEPINRFGRREWSGERLHRGEGRPSPEPPPAVPGRHVGPDRPSRSSHPSPRAGGRAAHRRPRGDPGTRDAQDHPLPVGGQRGAWPTPTCAPSAPGRQTTGRSRANSATCAKCSLAPAPPLP